MMIARHNFRRKKKLKKGKLVEKSIVAIAVIDTESTNLSCYSSIIWPGLGWSPHEIT